MPYTTSTSKGVFKKTKTYPIRLKFLIHRGTAIGPQAFNAGLSLLQKKKELSATNATNKTRMKKHIFIKFVPIRVFRG
jgi:hypothetical protein